MSIKDIKLSEIPEEISENGLRLYGPVSYETQVAVLSHYLHTLDGKHDIASGEKRYEILETIRDYIEYKRQQDKKNPIWNDVSDEVVTMAAERPLECDLFADFFRTFAGISHVCRGTQPSRTSRGCFLCAEIRSSQSEHRALCF